MDNHNLMVVSKNQNWCRAFGSWTGKFDISNNEQGAIVFDINGKRNMVYNAIVIVEEK